MMAAGDQAPGAADDGNATSEAYRVLVVEDDRSQAVFAESVLHGAGMQTRWVASAGEAMDALRAFHPDLVLMDLHLPDASGADLTATIRAEDAYAHLPIVFLTGDPDPETEYMALDSGADDFLSKPIRPRHLISAVQGRVRRARAVRNAQGGGGGAQDRDPQTGLFRRDWILSHLAASPAALLVEVQHLDALRDRLGFAGIETLLRAAGAVLAGIQPNAARLNDNSFLVLVDAHDEAQRTAIARAVRDGMGQPIDHAGMPMRLRMAVAHAALADIAGDPLGALDRTLRRAREESAHLAGFEPEAGSVQDPSQAAALRAALQDDRLELAFQPIAAVAGGDIAQFQVLLRMRDEHGLLRTAAELIRQAESTGLLGEVDHWVLGRALGLLETNPTHPDARRLFVSHSPQAIAADPGAARVRDALARHQVAPGALVIDLRMDDALVHGVAMAEFCHHLVPQGVGFCLGQYAHSDAAAALLRQLPLSYVRLSPRYSRLDADPELREELREVIGMAHASGLKVIGAQVESPAAAATLWMGGVDYIQGNLLQGAGSTLDFDFHHSVL
jgi:EAL domain-containing protein (putative c-di-GMP-specific phosphodiesterase class I)/DNA-binding response OmpR family regulator